MSRILVKIMFRYKWFAFRKFCICFESRIIKNCSLDSFFTHFFEVKFKYCSLSHIFKFFKANLKFSFLKKQSKHIWEYKLNVSYILTNRKIDILIFIS